ncbi:hypothetical protein diail_9574, partial [Diaporthe ilicicola]
MGQAQSHFARPTRLWHRRKPRATSSQLSHERYIQSSSSPFPEPDTSSLQFDGLAPRADQSPTTANTTPASSATHAETHSNAMPETRGKAVAQASRPPDESVSDQPTEAAEEPAPDRPPIKRKFTPPHRVRILTERAWRAENIYGNLHVHVTESLTRIRQQQTESDRTGAAARLETQIYDAADRCTLALEHLVGLFSTRFFDHAGPENIVSMMTTIEADACALDELRPKQRQLANYGYTIEKRLVQMKANILELAEVAKKVRGEGGEADAEGDTDPE